MSIEFPTNIGCDYAATMTQAGSIYAKEPDGTLTLLREVREKSQVVFQAISQTTVSTDDNSTVLPHFKGCRGNHVDGGLGLPGGTSGLGEDEISQLLAALIPPGSILPSTCLAVQGYLLCDGSAVSRADYAELFSAIGETYGAGDGSTTFNVPDLRRRTLWGASEKQPLGTVIEPGLPEIEGALKEIACASSANSAGAFNHKDVGNATLGNSGGSNYFNFFFAASRANLIYGSSDTVQPPAISINYFIKY